MTLRFSALKFLSFCTVKNVFFFSRVINKLLSLLSLDGLYCFGRGDAYLILADDLNFLKMKLMME